MRSCPLKDARAAGLKQYFTGKPCRKGHIAYRLTINGQCIECAKFYKKLDREKEINRKKAIEKSREWRKRNLARYNAKRKIWYEVNRAKIIATTAQWQKDNLEKVALIRKVTQGRRRAAKHGCETVRLADIKVIVQLQKGRCGYCRSHLGGDFHIDHIIPISKGGKHERRNLQALCPACNLAKHAKDPIDFARSLGRLL